MGCGPSKNLDRESIARDRKINRQLKRDYSREAQIVKLLLLGAGESGKSTIVKQMKLLHPVNNRKNAGFSDDEKIEAKEAIYSNVIDSIVQLLDALAMFGIQLNNSQLEEDRQQVLKFYENFETHRSSRNSMRLATPDDTFTELMRPCQLICESVSRLWTSEPVQEAYNRRNELQLCDSAAYFLNSVKKISDKNFVPSDQDILHTRVKTTGIIKIEFQYHEQVFNMYDVGGQRSERKKWIHCFDNVASILFIVALSEYDQVLFEDISTNRMHESLKLFGSMVNNEFLALTPFIVFFNKADLLKEKIQRKSIKVAFPDYTGEDTFEEASEFIQQKFLEQNKTSPHKRPIYPHVTTATDTELVKFVFNSVAEIILSDILRQTGLN